jgi:hypothetical protein
MSTFYNEARLTGHHDEARWLVPTINPDVALALEVILADIHRVRVRLRVLLAILNSNILTVS